MRSSTTPKGMWSAFCEVSWKDCPHLLTPEKRLSRENTIRQYGENSPLVQSFLYGRFQRSESMLEVFRNEHIEAAKRAMQPGAGQPIAGRPKASLDLSGGGDNQSAAFGQGTRIDRIENTKRPNEITMARELVARFKAIGILAHDVIVDGGGLGSTVIKFMEGEPCHFVGVTKYLNNQRPRNPKVFADRYTEDHWRFQELLLRGKIVLPMSEDLLKQMRARLYRMTETFKVKMEDKTIIRNRGGQSPDVLDSVVMFLNDVVIEGFDSVPRDDDPPHETWEQQAARSMKGGRLGDIFKGTRKSLLEAKPGHVFRRGRFGLPQRDVK